MVTCLTVVRATHNILRIIVTASGNSVIIRRDEYASLYRTACNIFESSFKYINETEEDYYFMNVAAIKFLKHLNTTEMMMTTELDINHIDVGFTYFDTSSAIVLMRSSYENLVTMAYHYFDGDLDRNRLDWYMFLGYKNRAKIKVKRPTPEIAAKIIEEQKDMEELSARLDSVGFKPPKKNDWKPSPWFKLGQDLGISSFVCNMYSFWSSHTHTGFDSLLQVNSAQKNHPSEEMKRNEENYIFMGAILAYFIENYVGVLKRLNYPNVEDFDLDLVHQLSDFMLTLQD